MIEVLKTEAGPVLTNAYLVYDPESKDAVVIDAPFDSADFFYEKINELGLNLRAIFLTHSHWDHTAEAPRLKSMTNAPVFIHREDEYRLLDPNSHSLIPMPEPLEKLKADKYMEDGEKLEFGTICFDVLHCPGHTEGGVCLVDHSNQMIYAGDVLFRNSVGRTDQPGGKSKVLGKTLKEKLMQLPDDYTVYCGHGPETTIGYERKTNPFINGLHNFSF